MLLLRSLGRRVAVRGALLVCVALIVVALGLGPLGAAVGLADQWTDQEAAGVLLTADRDIITSFEDRAAITALALDSWGAPLAGVPVAFWLDVPDAGWLTDAVVYTDENGMATTWFVPDF